MSKQARVELLSVWMEEYASVISRYKKTSEQRKEKSFDDLNSQQSLANLGENARLLGNRLF